VKAVGIHKVRPAVIRKDYARAKARMILKEAGVTRPPTNLEQICDHLDVQIHYHYTDGLEDSFVFLHCSVYHIVISISGREALDRWCIAHMLGNIVLGHCHLYTSDTIHKDILTDSERYILDREADIFAEELLMPMPWMDNHKSSSINQLEKVFRVSKEVINIRYNNLFGKKSIN
jgi:hypothetical protein